MDYNNILSDITNISLVILGISITIFTVVYSFILNKKSEIKEIIKKSNISTVSPDEIQKHSFGSKIINRYKQLNKNLAYLSILSSFIFLASVFLNRFLFSDTSQLSITFFWTLLILTILILIYFVLIFFRVITSYYSDTKI